MLKRFGSFIKGDKRIVLTITDRLPVGIIGYIMASYPPPDLYEESAILASIGNELLEGEKRTFAILFDCATFFL